MKKAKVILGIIIVFSLSSLVISYSNNRIASSLYYYSIDTVNQVSFCTTERYYNTQALGATIIASAASKPLYYNTRCTRTLPSTLLIYYTTLPY